MGDRTKMSEESNKATKIQIGALQGQYDSTKDSLLERVISLVCDIKPESHINARIE